MIRPSFKNCTIHIVIFSKTMLGISSYLYYIWVPFVCLLSDDTESVTGVTHLNISAKWSQIFMKTSAIINIGIGSRSKLFACACARNL